MLPMLIRNVYMQRQVLQIRQIWEIQHCPDLQSQHCRLPSKDTYQNPFDATLREIHA